MTKEKSDEIFMAINDYLADKPYHTNVYNTTDECGYNFGWLDIQCEISWGDWKHDHLRMNYLIETFCTEHNLSVFHSEEIIEEDGSDSYSAIHTWRILA